MIAAWRGVVDSDGDVWAWPTLAWTHDQAFVAFPYIDQALRCRWRQWEPNGEVDFEPGASDEDKQRVLKWVKEASSDGA